MNKITFIIPSINRPSLVNSIKSLLNQTNPNWECIIVYDGVEGPEFDDERIKTMKIKKIGKKGEGHGNAGLVRNEAIKIIETEWIAFLDDDDTIDSNYVHTLFEKYSNFDFVVWRMKNKKGKIYPDVSINELLIDKVGISISFKRIIEDKLFKNNGDHEDFEFVNNLQKQTKNFFITPEIYYNIRH
jgi:glycosyltransferase involved in cell wall biosynthesis